MSFFSALSYSQTQISGVVSDTNQKPLPYINIIVKDSLEKKTLQFTFSDDQGRYDLEIKNPGRYVLVFQSLGYKPKKIPFDVSDLKKQLTFNVFLEESVDQLDEVIIKSEKAISVRKDTISLKTKFFTDGTEQTVEDLLRKIPGITVNDKGTIKVGNQEIVKLMVDGDDFFERGYKILSKNMPAYPIEEVEVLKRYSDNRLLKDLEESNRIALNLKLDDKSKRLWFGNIKAGYTYDNFYEFKANLMNFGKKDKYYFLTNLNNTGYDATGDLNNLIRPSGGNEPGSLGDDQQLRSLIDLSGSLLDFTEDRTNFNNAELVSLNSIFNPSDKLKIKVLGFFNWDEKEFFSNTRQDVSLDMVNFTNTEDYRLRNKNQISFGKFDLTYDLSKSSLFEASTKYNNADFNDGANLTFNGNSTLQSLKHQNNLFDQKLNYTYRISEKKALLLTGRMIHEDQPQNLQVNQFFFPELFPGSDATDLAQRSDLEMNYYAADAHFFSRRKNNDLLELRLGNEYRKDLLNTTFSLLENTIIIDRPEGYQNETDYTVNDLYSKARYRKQLKNIGITGNLEIHQLFNRLENNQEVNRQDVFFVNPSIDFDWKINKRNTLDASYSYNTNNATILDVYGDFVLTGFRSFRKGTGSFNQLDASNFRFNYQLGNWSDRFFANIYATYVKNHDFFSTNSLLRQNFVQNEKIIIEDREFVFLSSKFDYYFKSIRSNLKLNLGFTRSEFKNIVNDLDLRTVLSRQYDYGLEIRSGFSGIFNYHLGTKWMYRSIETTIQNDFTDNVSFLDLSFVFNKKLNAELKSERYFFGNLSGDKSYYFIDFELQYQLKKDKITFGINGRNLLNTERFRNFAISDIGTSTTEYRLLPRFVLLKMEYRF